MTILSSFIPIDRFSIILADGEMSNSTKVSKTKHSDETEADSGQTAPGLFV